MGIDYMFNWFHVDRKKDNILCAFRNVIAGMLTMYFLTACAPAYQLKSIADYADLPNYGQDQIKTKKPQSLVVSLPPKLPKSESITFLGLYQCCNAKPALRSWTLPSEAVINSLKKSLSQIGHTLYISKDAFITKKDRLAVDKCVVPYITDSRFIKAKEGYYFSILVKLRVYDVKKLNWIGEVDIWGQASDVTGQMDFTLMRAKAFENAVSHVNNMVEFEKLITGEKI